jgi:iron complex outermembrane receptor protein
MKINDRKFRALSLLGAFCLGGVTMPISAQEIDGPQELAELVSSGQRDDTFGVLPDIPVESVFGLGLTPLQTPRSVSVITDDMLEQFGVSGIFDLVSFVPGAFSNSFFGIEGSLNLRGSIGENYFRGMKRIENPGNFPTAIGAASSVEVVRGPTPPTFGTGKISGYVNFIPKSSRADTGRYLEDTTGSVTLTLGSWEKKVFSTEIGGPLSLPIGKDAGYYVFAQLESSKGYYDHFFKENLVLQGSFDVDLTDRLRIQTGFMYQKFRGTENAGWNRITQDLIDNGTYYRGLGSAIPTTPDGRIAGNTLLELFQGSGAAPGPFDQPFYTFIGVNIGGPGQFLFGLPAVIPGPDGTNLNRLDANDPLLGTFTTLPTSKVLIDPLDRGEAEVFLTYFDTILEMENGGVLKNQFFFEIMPDRYKFATYGLSQLFDVSVFENKLTYEHTIEATENITIRNQYLATFRRYESDDKGDFYFEFFARRDLSQGPTPRDRILTAFENPALTQWSSQYDSIYSQLGVGLNSLVSIGNNFNLLLGGRIDHVDAKGTGYQFGRPGTRPIISPSDKQTAVAWNASASYTIKETIIPYITFARSDTINIDQSGAIPIDVLNAGNMLNTQELVEGGVKVNLIDGRLYGALSVFEQKTADVLDQRGNNLATNTNGWELELRYVPSRNLTLLATATWLSASYANPAQAQFNWFNVPSVGIDPALVYGGELTGNVDGLSFPKLPQVPNKTFSLIGIYRFDNGFGANISYTHIDKVWADRIGTITLPAVDLLDASIFYSTERFDVRFTVRNLTNERWFRGNFGFFFGGVTVLPELPRSQEFSVSYKF